MLTVVPLGSAPAGTAMVSLAPPEVSETVVDVVLDVVAEVGVPNVDAGTVPLVGGGALVGPVGGATTTCAVKVTVAVAVMARLESVVSVAV